MRLFGCVGSESAHSHNIRELVKEECFVIILGYDFFLFLHKKMNVMVYSSLDIRHFYSLKVLIFFLILHENICYGTH